MIDSIIQVPELFALIRLTCEENGVGCDIHPDLMDQHGSLLNDRLVILKIDEYYNSKKIANRPKSIDYLVLVKCCDDVSYSLYLVELKNTADREQLRPSGIIKKFATTVDDFLNKEFFDIFSKAEYKNIKLFLVSQKDPDSNKMHKNRSSQFDAFSSAKPFDLLGQSVMIEPRLPNPQIVPC